MIIQRRRFKHTATFEERLAEEAARFRKAANEATPGMARELLLKRARQADTASHMSEWLGSPGLQPPKLMPPASARFASNR
jgi:hypothetical protein